MSTASKCAALVCLEMALYEVYAHSELRRYKTHVCSKATLIQIFCLLLMVIPPFFVAYRSEGLYINVILRVKNSEKFPASCRSELAGATA